MRARALPDPVVDNKIYSGQKTDMAVTLICPNLLCRSILQVPDSIRGRKVRCGKCGKEFLVPAFDHSKQSANAPAENTSAKPTK